MSSDVENLAWAGRAWSALTTLSRVEDMPAGVRRELRRLAASAPQQVEAVGVRVLADAEEHARGRA